MGLPLFYNPALTGNLFVNFQIVFPKTLNDNQISNLTNILPKPKKET